MRRIRAIAPPLGDSRLRERLIEVTPSGKRASGKSGSARKAGRPRTGAPRRRSTKSDTSVEAPEAITPPEVETPRAMESPPPEAPRPLPPPPVAVSGVASGFADGIFDPAEGVGPAVSFEDASDELIAVDETTVKFEATGESHAARPAESHVRGTASHASADGLPEARAARPAAGPGSRAPTPGFRTDPGFAIGFDDELVSEAVAESVPDDRWEAVGTPDAVEPFEARDAEGETSAFTASRSQDEDGEARRGRRRRGRRGGRGRRRGRDRESEDAVGDEPSTRDAERESPTESASPRADEDADQEVVTEEDEIADEDTLRAMAGPVALPGVTRETDVDEKAPPRRRGRRPVYEDEVEVPPAETDELPANREMLINGSDPDECRIAILRDGRLDELYIERATQVSNVMNIYKGRVTNVEPSIQAAFIDFGLPTHGFLHISDLHPRYFPESKGEPELVGRKTPRRARPPIQNCLRRGQEVIVQVIKEGIGTKGPTLSTYISLPGRFLVMMPGMDQHGVSRKVEDPEARRKTREVLNQLTLPKDMGFIVRTAGVGRSQRDLQRDLNYLVRLWNQVAQRTRDEPAPAELYKESDLVIRTIRDVYDSSLKRIIVDNPHVAERVREFLAIASPQAEDAVTVYDGAEPVFHRFGIEAEIDKLHSRVVPLPCGGSLVIESTEALVAIDVNSGRFRVHENAEETAYRVNLEAADEIARQLRLRDLGGLIICDFIDMMQDKHRRAVERRLAEALRSHKERAKLLRISRFGILEMTRQRQRPSFAKNTFAECPRCGGSGRVKTTESVCLDVMRQIRMASQREGVASIDVSVSLPVATELLNRKRHALTDLERAGGLAIRIHAETGFAVDEVRLACVDRRGREVPTGAGAAPATLRPVAQPTLASRPAVPAGPGDRAGGSRGRRGSRGGRGRRGRGGQKPANADAVGGSSDASHSEGEGAAQPASTSRGTRERSTGRKSGPPRSR